MPSILILEDDITFSLMLKTWLGRKGFEVSSVSSVSDARSRIEDASFDLILSDLRLPDGDGIDLLKWIKENNFVIPLIMMTSYAEIQTAVHMLTNFMKTLHHCFSLAKQVLARLFFQPALQMNLYKRVTASFSPLC